MRASPALTTYLQAREAFHATPYLDSAGKWTIGYGHVIRAHEKASLKRVTGGQADALLVADVSPIALYLDALNLKTSLTQQQFDALVSLAFNIGLKAFENSTLLKLLRVADFAGAAAQFDRWVYITVPHPDGIGTIKRVLRGLVNRRRMDRAIFERGEYAA